MPLLQTPNSKPLKLQLRRDLVRSIKRGHAWVYPEALRQLPQASRGAHAILLDNRGGREIARGFYDADGAIALRICTTRRGQPLDEVWAEARLQHALALRRQLIDLKSTTAYRLINGEGDGLPGLVCDVYANGAVLKIDGPAAEAFWHPAGIADWLGEELQLEWVYQRFRGRKDPAGKVLYGADPPASIEFLENAIRFTADAVRGHKTGFYLDQRDNRALIGSLAAGKRVLNVFSYTGAFSVYAGLGNASEVTSVDSAGPVLEVADQHWELNQLPAKKHHSVVADAFEFLEAAIKEKRTWDLVILDPPSFAPSEQALPRALAAYKKLIALGASVTSPGGLLAAASCSSHVRREAFREVCEEAVSEARRSAALLAFNGQPPDHPAPLVMPELRYLKFALMQLSE